MAARLPSFLLIADPHASGGRMRVRLPAVFDALREAGAIFETALARSEDDATHMVRNALRTSTPGIAVVGGDAVVNAALNGFFDDEGRAVETEAWLAPMPFGKTSDLRRSLGLSSNPSALSTRIVWAKPRPMDVGFITLRTPHGDTVRRAFLNAVTLGTPAAISDSIRRHHEGLSSAAAAVFTLARAVGSMGTRRVRIGLDDDRFEEVDVSLLTVANGRFVGGGMQMAPAASMEDGVFDVVHVDATFGVRDRTALLRDVYRGTVLSRSDSHCNRARTVTLEPADWKGTLPLSVDGISLGELPATLELRPSAVRVRA